MSALELSANFSVYYRSADYRYLYRRPQTPCKIENIFVHEISTHQYLIFLQVKPTIQTTIFDPVLETTILQSAETLQIIGLPAVRAKRLYIIHEKGSRIPNRDTVSGIPSGLLQIDPSGRDPGHLLRTADRDQPCFGQTSDISPLLRIPHS